MNSAATNVDTHRVSAYTAPHEPAREFVGVSETACAVVMRTIYAVRVASIRRQDAQAALSEIQRCDVKPRQTS